MKRKILIVMLALALVATSFAGCSPRDKISGTLVVGITEASGNFNPLYYSSAYDGYVVDLVFQQLITRNWDGEFEEGDGVAESWEFSNGDKTITFNMKEDAKFSDGEPLTAHDVVFTYQAIADPTYDGRYGSYVRDLKGYEAYASGETEDFEGVVAVDDHTVEFHFEEVLRVNFANAGFHIMPKHYYGPDWEPGETTSLQTKNSEPLGSGPYIVEQFQDKEFVSLKRNENFVGEGYLIEEIILKFVEMTTDIVELTTGNVDLLTGMIEPEKINQAKEADKEFNSYPRSGYGYVKTNTAYGATADYRVRQALYYAFNRDEFVNNYFLDEETGDVLAVTQAHPFSQVSWAMTDELTAALNDYDFDLEKAKEILDDAGWVLNADGKREKDGEILTLKIAAMPDHDILDMLIPMWNRDWGQGLGIELDVAYLEFNTILDYVIYESDSNVEEWSMFFLATTISTPDPHTLYSSFHSDYIGNGMDNTSRYSNPEIDSLFDEGKSIMEIEEARPIYQEIVTILNEEAVMMPVYANTYFDLYDGKLQDFETNSLYNWVKAMKDARIVD